MAVFTKKKLDMIDGDVSVYTAIEPDMFPPSLFDYLYHNTPWEQRSVTVYGREFPEPRLTCWYGEKGYQYSGSIRDPLPMTPMLKNLRDEMNDLTETTFNGVLLNLYADGSHGVGYHSDDESELGKEPIIVSLSLGAERRFVFKHRSSFDRYTKPPVKRSGDVVELDLLHGDILVMRGKTQENWKHALPKTKRVVGPRINLTFRNIIH